MLDYFAEFARNAPARIEPDYGLEFVGLEIDRGAEYPVTVTLRHVSGEREGEERTVHAKYVVGCDGAHSKVREAIGRQHLGKVANHAWGVMDVLATTDFPDIRTKCAIQSASGGSILHIPARAGICSVCTWTWARCPRTTTARCARPPWKPPWPRPTASSTPTPWR
ncbi:hypothetical protein HML84_07415 [Alcanivorax sp. IO_7]|nr:hypothetical protein HML84_07415 [Alcanivorax sp. IO_7]